MVVLTFPGLAKATPSGFVGSLESRVQKLEDTVFTKKEAEATENTRKAERVADTERTDAASDRAFLLSCIAFGFASSTTLRATVDVCMRRRDLAPKA